MSTSVLKIGHRGAKNYVTENTIQSIEKALECGVDAVEIDVHLCASGELVVFHDFTLDRITDGSGEVAKFTLFQLKALTVVGGFKIPTLTEVLRVINKRCILNIELKGKFTAAKTCELIAFEIAENNWSYKDFILSSFQQKELVKVYEIDKNIPLAVLTKANVADAITFAKTIDSKIIHPNFALLTEDNVKLSQQEGYTINTWTVNDPETIARMKRYGVNGIISDVPDKI